MSTRTLGYGVLAAADTLLAGLGARRARWLTKPLLMPALAGCVPAAGPDLRTAIALSGVGDIALLGRGSAAFGAGLGSFLGGHLAYVHVMNRLRQGERHVPATVLLALAGVGQAAALARSAGPLAGPVLAYSAVISSMGSAALSVRALDDSERAAVRSLQAGAVCFIVSDALVGTRRFLAPERLDRRLDAAVMATYTLAQWLLVTGSSRLEALRMR